MLNIEPIRKHISALDFKKINTVLIVSHIDADGISAAAIAADTLQKLRIEHDVKFVKRLDANNIEEIKDFNADLVWYTDIGSGSKHMIDHAAIITDHHAPLPLQEHHSLAIDINAHTLGMDGTIEVSGAGMTLLASLAIKKAQDLSNAQLAVVGAVGDLQDNAYRGLVGLNGEILLEGVKQQHVVPSYDLFYYGKETRPLHKMLQYATDPIIPGISGNEYACLEFLRAQQISLKNDDWRAWVELSKDEKKKVISGLVRRFLYSSLGWSEAIRIVGECYYFPDEEPGTETHEAKEFATLLNACGRYNDAPTALRVCMGDRGSAFQKARSNLHTHRRVLVESLNFVMNVVGIEDQGAVFYFHCGNRVVETVVGTVAGMILNSGEFGDTKPIIGFAASADGGIKVSARGTKRLVARGLNLAVACRDAAQHVGGHGGGHDIAAGATIPEGMEEEFLNCVGKIIRAQLGGG